MKDHLFKISVKDKLLWHKTDVPLGIIIQNHSIVSLNLWFK